MKKERNENEPLLYSDHPRPVTRRQFLSQGLIGFSGALVMPSFFNILHSTKAFAAEDCGGDGATAFIPCLIFDMAGGAGLPGNFLVGGSEGPEQLLKSYYSLGWDPRATGAYTKPYGLPMATVSQLRVGLEQTASAEARARLRMGSFCHFAQDDSSNNPLSMIHYLLKVGYAGKYFKNGSGSNNSLSGGNSAPAEPDSSKKLLYVSSFNDVLDNVKYGKILSDVPKEKLKAAGRSMLEVTLEQIKAFMGSAEGEKLGKLARCAYEENMNSGDTLDVDPRLDPLYQQVYNINQFSADNAQEVIASSIVKNVLSGFSGPGVISLGGCDYHTGNQAVGDQKDLEMGQLIGRAIESAHRSKKPLFFQLITDGGVYAAYGTRNWTGDSGDRCMTVIGYYHPTEAATFVNPQNPQIGHYTNGEGVNRATFVGDNQARVAASCFANYLNLHKLKPEDFDQKFRQTISAGFLTPPDFSKVQIFT